MTAAVGTGRRAPRGRRRTVQLPRPAWATDWWWPKGDALPAGALPWDQPDDVLGALNRVVTEIPPRMHHYIWVALLPYPNGKAARPRSPVEQARWRAHAMNRLAGWLAERLPLGSPVEKRGLAALIDRGYSRHGVALDGVRAAVELFQADMAQRVRVGSAGNSRDCGVPKDWASSDVPETVEYWFVRCALKSSRDFLRQADEAYGDVHDQSSDDALDQDRLSLDWRRSYEDREAPTLYETAALPAPIETLSTPSPEMDEPSALAQRVAAAEARAITRIRARSIKQAAAFQNDLDEKRYDALNPDLDEGERSRQRGHMGKVRKTADWADFLIDLKEARADAEAEELAESRYLATLRRQR